MIFNKGLKKRIEELETKNTQMVRLLGEQELRITTLNARAATSEQTKAAAITLYQNAQGRADQLAIENALLLGIEPEKAKTTLLQDYLQRLLNESDAA